MKDMKYIQYDINIIIIGIQLQDEPCAIMRVMPAAALSPFTIIGHCDFYDHHNCFLFPLLLFFATGRVPGYLPLLPSCC